MFGKNKKKEGNIGGRPQTAFRENKTNWQRLKGMGVRDTSKFRDVYEDQQLERGYLEQKQTKTTRRVVSIGTGILVFVTIFVFWTWIQKFYVGSHGINKSFAFFLFRPLKMFGKKFFFSAVAGLGVGAAIDVQLMRNLDAQNAMVDTSDVNQHHNDQHVALPQEIQHEYDWFPDAGAEANVQVSTIISHMMLNTKGLKKVKLTRFEGGNPVIQDGEYVYDSVPIIDMKFGHSVFEASGLPARLMKFYDTRAIDYNKGNKNRDKLKGYDTVADMINGDWELPPYEPQRPCGAYLVDSAPTNTLVAAMTRSGKGQGVIEPTIDCWSREKRKNNMLLNDPKGELLLKFYARLTVRGYQVIQFNLMNELKTDIYNPLALASEAAMSGDFKNCATFIEAIANVFFPLDGGEDPVWPNAANNSFKRTSYGMIDFYIEEAKELIKNSKQKGESDQLLSTELDILWSKVTLYNCYQLFVQLASKKLPNEATKFKNELEVYNTAKNLEDSGKGNASSKEILETSPIAKMSASQIKRKLDECEELNKIWNNEKELDMLSLYFNATEMLPVNSMRTLVANANNSLKTMGAAEKMLASVQAIAITAMSFFTDPTISALTSGSPSQNIDLAGFSFPRRLGVRFSSAYIEKYRLLGNRVKWSAYKDNAFKEDLGEMFHHSDVIGRMGWAKYAFEGIFPSDVAYIKLEIFDMKTSLPTKTFYFKFKKSYKTSLDGRYYIKDPILNEKIVLNGILTELLPKNTPNGVIYVPGDTVTKGRKVICNEDISTTVEDDKNVIIDRMAKYTEKPKAAFMITPPNKLMYAKLPLILIKQLVDLNFDQSYVTKDSQKPLYKTRYMLDEFWYY